MHRDSVQHDIKRRVSYSKKIANDFHRQKSILDAYDSYYGHYRDTDKITKGKMNYDLFNGRLDVDQYSTGGDVTIQGEKISLNNYEIVHYPIIAQLANTIHGEVINRPFIASVKDNSPSAKTMYMKKRNELLGNWFNQSVIEPVRQKVSMQWMQQNGVEDVFMLDAEQQQQMMADVEQRMKSEVPKDVQDFLANGYRNPNQKVLQQLLDAHIRTDEIIEKSYEAAKHGIAMGESIYRIGMFHEMPKFDLVNELYFTWGGSQNTEWIQKGAWCRYEEWLRYEDIIQLFSEDLRDKDIKVLEGLVEPIGGFRTAQEYGQDKSRQANLTGLERATQFEISINSDELIQKFGHVDIKKKEGQAKMVEIMNNVATKYGHTYGYGLYNYGFRVAHFNFMDQRKLRRVTKNENGTLNKYWFDESYERQANDVEIRDVWVNEAWQGYKIGTNAEPVYAKIERIPWQFPSINNPFTAELSYYGKAYNTHMNNSKNVSHIDRGKPWQLEFDVEMAALKHDLKTHIGSVFRMVMDLKPDNYKLQEWIDMIVNFKIMPINPNKPGMNRVDPAIMGQLEMGKLNDIAGRVQLLDFIRNNLIQDMFFSQARVGQVGQYATQANIQTNQTASYNQTENFFYTHRSILDKALSGYLKVIRYCAKKNPWMYENVLDDVGLAYLASMPAWEPYIDVSVSGSGKETQDLERVRSIAMQMASTSQDPMTIIKLAVSDNQSEIMDILEAEKFERLAREDAMRQEQQQMAQAQIEAQEQMHKDTAEREYTMHKEKLASQEARAAIDSEKFRKQQDVDDNQVADAIEKALIELASKERMHDKDIEVDHRKLDIEERKVDAISKQKVRKS